jgi:AraC-like DNA-binding protein
MHFRETARPPHQLLARWVSSVDVMQMQPGISVDALFFPRTDAALIVRWARDGAAQISVLGPLGAARRKTLVTPTHSVRVNLRPGHARALFGVPMHTLRDGIVDATALFGTRGDALRSRLEEGGPLKLDEILADAFGSLTPAQSFAPQARLVVAAKSCLATSGARVARIAKDLGVSERHLRRTFLDVVGVTPKHQARIARLGQVRACDVSSPLARTAREAGFCDQSHLSLDVRSLGLSVTDLRR